MSARTSLAVFAGIAIAAIGGATLGVGLTIREETSALATAGVEAQARVVSLRSSGTGSTKSYRVFLRVEGSPPAERDARISQEQFERLAEGMSITVTYVPARADALVLGPAAVIQRVASRANWVIGGGSVVLAAGAAVLIAAIRGRRARPSPEGTPPGRDEHPGA